MKHLLLFFILIFISGCGQKQSGRIAEEINTKALRELLSQALDSSKAANTRLANLVDFTFLFKNDYKTVAADSFIINNKTFYYILLENTGPFNNRFAVYDSLLNPLLIDKSLNGKIYFEKINAGGKEFIKIDEVYLSKDSLLLNRLSLYSADTSGVFLSFRVYTKLAKPDIEYFQDIIGISDTAIRSRISSSIETLISNKEDNFFFDKSSKKYYSTQNLFDEFVKNEVESPGNKPMTDRLTDSTRIK